MSGCALRAFARPRFAHRRSCRCRCAAVGLSHSTTVEADTDTRPTAATGTACRCGMPTSYSQRDIGARSSPTPCSPSPNTPCLACALTSTPNWWSATASRPRPPIGCLPGYAADFCSGPKTSKGRTAYAVRREFTGVLSAPACAHTSYPRRISRSPAQVHRCRSQSNTSTAKHTPFGRPVPPGEEPDGLTPN